MKYKIYIKKEDLQ